MVIISILTFCRTKSNKKAQHRQNQSLSPRLTNFRKRKYSSFVARLSATFPTERLRGSVKVKLRHGAQENFHTLFRAFSVSVACDFDNAVFYGSNFCKKSSPSYVRGTTRVSVVCDDGRFIFPKESRACEAPDRGEGVRINNRRTPLAKGHPLLAKRGSFLQALVTSKNFRHR